MADAFLDATAQAELVRTGEASPLELVDDAITRIEKLNGELNAVIHPLFDKARARKRAARCPTGRSAACRSVQGSAVRGSRATRPRRHAVPAATRAGTRDHTDALAQRYLDAGFVVLGRTNTPELGLVPTTEPRGVRTDAQPVGHERTRPAVRAAVRRPRSRAAWSRSRTRTTAAGRSASPRAAAASSV